MSHSTHSLGVMCADCLAQLVADDCCTGHGSTYQAATPWAATTWPQHECFTKEQA